ncbi:glycosyltransferase family 4 protein [bacterium]|nr:glycosyltransferase family 4 protein [bacterium]
MAHTKKPKIALVHDWLTNFAGAEQVLLSLMELFPEAPIYTSIYKPEKMPAEFKTRTVYTSSLQKFSFIPHQLLFPNMAKAFEEFNFSDYDIVISSSHASSKGIITKPETLHICYCHTPTRYLWSHYFEYLNQMQFGVLNPIIRMRMPRIAHKLRIWDRLAADRVDLWVSNSNNVKKRIKKYYKRNATIIYPPIDTNFFELEENKKNYYITASRLIPYKKIELIIETFNKLGKEIKIIGAGPKEKEFRKIAKENVKILGRVTDDELKRYYKEAKGFIFAAEEDFGIVPIEAMASGTPVIAYQKGGAIETIQDGKTGVFFKEQTKESLIDAINRFENASFRAKDIREYALSFNKNRFKKEFLEYVKKNYESFINE